MILHVFLVFNFVMFPNTNLVEIIFPQSFDRFRAVVCGKFFIVTWIASIINKIRFSGIVKREFIRFIFIPSRISSFCGCQTDFSEFLIKPHWAKLFLTNSASSTAKPGEREAPRPLSIYAQFLFCPYKQKN